MHGAGEDDAEPQEGREMCAAVGRLVFERADGPHGVDPLLWELLLVWRRREYEHECLTRARLAAAFTRAPEGEHERG